jgi:hypothetical protein
MVVKANQLGALRAPPISPPPRSESVAKEPPLRGTGRPSPSRRRAGSRPLARARVANRQPVLCAAGGRSSDPQSLVARAGAWGGGGSTRRSRIGRTMRPPLPRRRSARSKRSTSRGARLSVRRIQRTRPGRRHRGLPGRDSSLQASRWPRRSGRPDTRRALRRQDGERAGSRTGPDARSEAGPEADADAERRLGRGPAVRRQLQGRAAGVGDRDHQAAAVRRDRQGRATSVA